MFLAYDDTHIHGIGETAEAAIADALSNCHDLTRLKTSECTAALAQQVESEGGAIAWDEGEDGFLCTTDEAR
jgi:hypothetical protein